MCVCVLTEPCVFGLWTKNDKFFMRLDGSETSITFVQPFEFSTGYKVK